MKRSDYQILISYLRSNYPLEACGLLAGKDSIITHNYPIDNILRSPTAFEMDPKQQIKTILDIEKKGLQLLGIYHSHPLGPQSPSEIDIAQAYYPEVAHLIVSFLDNTNPITRAFTITEDEVNEIPFMIE